MQFLVSPCHLLEKVGPHALGLTASPEVKLEKICIEDSLENHLQHINMHFLELKKTGTLEEQVWSISHLYEY